MKNSSCSVSLIYILVFIYLFTPFAIAFATFLEDSEINLNPNDYARITDVEYKAVLVDEPRK